MMQLSLRVSVIKSNVFMNRVFPSGLKYCNVDEA